MCILRVMECSQGATAHAGGVSVLRSATQQAWHGHLVISQCVREHCFEELGCRLDNPEFAGSHALPTMAEGERHAADGNRTQIVSTSMTSMISIKGTD